MDLKRGIDKAVEAIVASLADLSQEIDDKTKSHKLVQFQQIMTNLSEI